MTDHTLIARALFDSFQAGDIETARRLCHEDFAGSQNGGGAMNRDGLLGFVNAVKAKVPDFRYEDIECAATADGFVEEHTIKGSLPGGEELNLRLCVVASIKDGQVHTVREYVDTARAIGLAKALAG